METFIGDILTIAVETNIDLTGLTLELWYKKPDDTEGYWNATQDPSDNSVALYTTQESDLDTVGSWKVQIYAYNNFNKLHGRFCEFKVHTPISFESV